MGENFQSHWLKFSPIFLKKEDLEIDLPDSLCGICSCDKYLCSCWLNNELSRVQESIL
jgi:hypothetical protein